MSVELSLVLHHLDMVDWDARPFDMFNYCRLCRTYIALITEVSGVDIDLDMLVFFAALIK